MENDPHQFVTVFTTQNPEQLANCSLVLNALNIPFFISEDDGNYVLLVAEKHRERASHQIQQYLEENVGWPPKQDLEEQNNSPFQPPTIIVIGALILLYSVTGPWSERSSWFEFGAGNSAKILENGEYYRLITALTLHADLVHLLGNCLLGGFVIHFLCRAVGPGLGIFSILVASFIGNFTNVYLRGPGHLFVGFSTAVFATIGILTVLNFQSKRQLSGLHLILPFMGGIALLAMTGSSGERTDLGAHLFGLAGGIVTGFVLTAQKIRHYRESPRYQLMLFLITISAVFFCWRLAMVVVY